MVKGIKNGKKRNYCTVDEKVAILRRHLVDKVPVSDLCDEYGTQPSVFYGPSGRMDPWSVPPRRRADPARRTARAPSGR